MWEVLLASAGLFLLVGVILQLGHIADCLKAVAKAITKAAESPPEQIAEAEVRVGIAGEDLKVGDSVRVVIEDGVSRYYRVDSVHRGGSIHDTMKSAGPIRKPVEDEEPGSFGGRLSPDQCDHRHAKKVARTLKPGDKFPCETCRSQMLVIDEQASDTIRRTAIPVSA